MKRGIDTNLQPNKIAREAFLRLFGLMVAVGMTRMVVKGPTVGSSWSAILQTRFLAKRLKVMECAGASEYDRVKEGFMVLLETVKGPHASSLIVYM